MIIPFDANGHPNVMGDMTKCQECPRSSYVVIRYHTSAGAVNLPLCNACADAFWKKWGGTAIGHSASIFDAHDCNRPSWAGGLKEG